MVSLVDGAHAGEGWFVGWLAHGAFKFTAPDKAM